MWMVLHLDDAVYTEYDQLRHVCVSVVDDTHRVLLGRREIAALSAEGLVPAIVTDRLQSVTAEFVAQVCRDHAEAIHRRYVVPVVRMRSLGDEDSRIEENGALLRVRYRMNEPRSARVFA